MYEQKSDSWARAVATILVIGAATLTTGTACAQECVLAPEGLVGWWPGDVDATDIESVNHGSPVGTTTFAAGKVLGGFFFDGGNGHVEITDAASLRPTGAITVDAWVRVDALPDGVAAHLVDRHTSEAGKPFQGYLLATNGPAGFSVFTTLGQFTAIGTTNIVGDGAFHHLAGTYDGTTVSVFVDGVLEASTSGAGPIAYPATLDVWLGANQQPSQYVRSLSGIIDEVEIFARALNTAEIQAIFNAGSHGKCKDEDGDGFRPPDDCDEGDPSIHPNAAEISFNFVDENCDGNLGDCDPCGTWLNHGQYVRCVADAVGDCSTNAFTPEEADAFVSSAVHSDIGKTGFVPPECQP